MIMMFDVVVVVAATTTITRTQGVALTHMIAHSIDI
jgi:hypothetical protein